MSEPTNSGFPFAEMPDADGLDFASIFGGAHSGAAPSDVNPFEAALAQQASPPASVPPAKSQETAPQPAAQTAPQPTPVPPAAQSAQHEQPAPAPAVQPAAPDTQPALDIDPLPGRRSPTPV